MDASNTSGRQRSSSHEDATYRPHLTASSASEDKKDSIRNFSEKYNASPDSSEWDLDTDDIRSISSTELYESRPNRWRGPASTWRGLTEQDRLAHDALISLRNQDLAKHLYTAFSLKRRLQDAGKGSGDDEDDFDALTGSRVPSSNWAPPKSWTAWPMRAHLVPHDYELMTDLPDDPLEALTLRLPLSYEEGLARPAVAVEELLCATMLRTASSRFHRRQLLGQFDSEEVAMVIQSQNDQGSSPINGSGEGVWPSTGPPSAQLNSSPPPFDSPPPTTNGGATYTPAPAADDEVSHVLLRPAAHRIMQLLDATLLRLHDARSRAAVELSGSSCTSSSDQGQDSADDLHAPPINNRNRGAPRGKKASQPPKISDTEAGSGNGGKRRVGRPRKVYLPQDGESKREMRMRIARQRHEAIPLLSDDDENDMDGETSPGNPSAAATKDKGPETHTENKVVVKHEGESEREYQVRVAKEKNLQMPEFLSDDGNDDIKIEASNAPMQAPFFRNSKTAEKTMDIEGEIAGAPTKGKAAREASRRLRQKERTMGRWPLRDWSDVVGAAALAGFSPSVVARATQRCATLFGQAMEMHTITEVPVVTGLRKRKRPAASGLKTRVYQPGAPLSDTSLTSGDGGGYSSDNDGLVRVRMERLRSMSREPSLPADRGRRMAAWSSDGEDSKGIVAAPARSRAGSSVAPDPLLLPCPHPTCSRFCKGFTRKANLTRHLRLVHNEAESSGRSRRGRIRGRDDSSFVGSDDDGHDGGGGGDDVGDNDNDDKYSESEDDLGSADEMDGAVHVDGFLRPIKIRKGWRDRGLF